MTQKYPGKRYRTMYHGTTLSAAYNIIKVGFRVSETGMLGRGVYVSRDKEKAERYPLFTTEPKVVLKLSVKVGKVKKIDKKGHPLQYTWHDHGYDCAWVPPRCGMVPSGLEKDCIYDPWRIRVTDVVIAPPEHKNALRQLIASLHKLLFQFNLQQKGVKNNNAQVY